MEHRLDDIGIESATERRVGRENDQRNLLHRTLLIERQLNIGCRYQERLEDMLQHIFIREHILDGRLGMVEFARSHHFHRTGDLPRAIDGSDATLDFFQRWHDRPPSR